MRNLLRPIALAVLVATTFSVEKGVAADANTIRYGIDDEQNINRLAQFVAEKKGFFASEGVKVDLVRLKSAFRAGPGQATENLPTVREAMASGSIDMSRQQLPLLIHDDMVGAKYIGVGVATNNPEYFLVAGPGGCFIALAACSQRRPPYDDPFNDFKKGDVVAVTNPWNGITIWAKELFSRNGMPAQDIIWKSIAGSDARIGCLTSDECAAAVLDQPAIFNARRVVVYGRTNDIEPQLYQLDIATPDWAAAHRDLVTKYIRATATAMRFIMDAKNRDDTLDAVIELTKQPQEESRLMLANILKPANRMFQTSAPDMANVKAVIQLLGKYGELKRPLPSPERFVDPSYARDAHLPPVAAGK